MEKAHQVPTVDLETAVNEIMNVKNLITVVQWWTTKMMDCKAKEKSLYILSIEGDVYQSILGTAQELLAQLQQSMDAALEQGYEVLKREKVQA